MTLFKLTNSMSRLVLLGSAAFLLHGGVVLAADRTDDAQAQARELLAGTATRSTGATSAALPAATSQSALDPQEQARRFILGTSRAETAVKSYSALNSKTTPSSSAERRGNRRVYPDAQTLAERMITGAG